MQRRDFTQPVRRDSPYYTPAPAENKKSTADLAAEILRIQKLQREKFLKIFSFIVVGLLLIGAAILLTSFIAHNRLKKTVPETVYNQVTFNLYVPSGSKYRLDKSNVQYENGVVSMQFASGSDKYVLTEQAKPADFQLNRFGSSQDLTNANQITTPFGPGIIGVVGGQNIAIISTQKTLLTMVLLVESGGDKLLPALMSLKQIK